MAMMQLDILVIASVNLHCNITLIFIKFSATFSLVFGNETSIKYHYSNFRSGSSCTEYVT